MSEVTEAAEVPETAGVHEASTPRRTQGPLVTVFAGIIIGAVEVVLAVAFAAVVFGAYLVPRLADGIGLYLAAAALTLGILAWRAGRRGVVGSVQDAAVVVLALVAKETAGKVQSLTQIGEVASIGDFKPPDVFLTVIGATLVVTVGCGVIFLVLGIFRLGNLVRFVPFPVVGGFLAGTGWLLFTRGIHVSSGIEPHLRTFDDLFLGSYGIKHAGPAIVFGVALLLAVRIIQKPLVIPIGIGLGVVAFVVGLLVTGSNLQDAKDGAWLLGPFESARLWQPWTLRAISGADWSMVLAQWYQIAAAIFIAVLAILFNISGSELVLRKDLDTNRELRDAGVLNVISGGLGGPPGYHALSLTALAHRMNVNARSAGLVAALVPLAAVIFGASVVELIPKALVGGVLVFLGLAFLVEWVWDTRKTLPRLEYAVVLVILAGIITLGFLNGLVLGLVMAIVLFAVSYGRIKLVREVSFGDTFHSNVDRPQAERAALREMGDRVQLLRVNGFVFFGSANGLLERIRKRVEASAPRFLLIDLRRASGVDASSAAAFLKVIHLAEASGFEVVLAGASDKVRSQLERGGIAEEPGLVAFEPDLDRGLQRCEDALLSEAGVEAGEPELAAGMPPGLEPYLERIELAQGTVLIHQDDPPEDLYVLESGALQVETRTPEGTRMRLRTIRPGVVVGEVAMYAGTPRTADVVAETPSVVRRLSQASFQRMESESPVLAAATHRWLASTLAERLGDRIRALDALLD